MSRTDSLPELFDTWTYALLGGAVALAGELGARVGGWLAGCGDRSAPPAAGG